MKKTVSFFTPNTCEKFVLCRKIGKNQALDFQRQSATTAGHRLVFILPLSLKPDQRSYGPYLSDVTKNAPAASVSQPWKPRFEQPEPNAFRRS
jgi:hypothetical protein